MPPAKKDARLEKNRKKLLKAIKNAPPSPAPTGKTVGNFRTTLLVEWTKPGYMGDVRRVEIQRFPGTQADWDSALTPHEAHMLGALLISWARQP